MVELEHVYKRYGSLFAVSDVTFRVPSGQVVGFLGPNGAGKTTTMKMITGLVSPTAGSIRVCEKDIFDHSMACKTAIGFLPETPPVYREMLVEDYLKFVAEIRGVHRKSIKSRVNHALEQCQIAHVRHRLVGNLSKGYQQRVGIAQAIIHDPAVIILDEPTIGLDPAQILEIRSLIKSFSQVRTVILSTHILQEVTAICDRVIIINNGRIVADQALSDTSQEGDVAFLIDIVNWEKDTLQRLNDSRLVSQCRRKHEGTHEVLVKLNEPVKDIFTLIKDLNSHGLQVRHVRPSSMNIEDFYLDVVMGETQETRV